MFKNKGAEPTKKQNIVKPNVLNPLVHVVDVNMAITKSKVIRKPIKKKPTVDWEEGQRQQQYFVKTVQKMQVKDPAQNLFRKKKHNGVQVG
jgi:hypothetical protein